MCVENLAYNTCGNVIRDVGEDFVLLGGNVILQEIIGYDLDIAETFKPPEQLSRKIGVFFNGNDFMSDLGQLRRDDPAPGPNFVDSIRLLDRACIEQLAHKL